MLDSDYIAPAGATAVVQIAHDTFGYVYTMRVEGVTPTEQHAGIVFFASNCQSGPVSVFHELPDERAHLFDLEHAGDHRIAVMKPGDKLITTELELDENGDIVVTGEYTVPADAVDKETRFFAAC
jgi:hypothetical protein